MWRDLGKLLFVILMGVIGILSADEVISRTSPNPFDCVMQNIVSSSRVNK